MKRVNIISDELKNLAPALIPAQGIQVFTVPDGYFEEFALTFYPDNILNSVPAMSAPEGYFDGFAASVMLKIKAGETSLPVGSEHDELPRVLKSISREMPYEIPPGFMGSFSGKMLKKVRPPKVVSLSSVKKSMFRYAAAAVVTGLLGLGIFNGMNGKVADVESTRNAILADAKLILSTNSFEQTLESISSDDIVSYLETTGQDVEAAVVATAASQSDLPEPVEYLLDDGTLEKFLNDLNIQTLN